METGHKEPTNAKDRARFARFDPEFQQEARELAAHLYDGSRTVAAAWHEAVDRCEAWQRENGIPLGTIAAVMDGTI